MSRSGRVTLLFVAAAITGLSPPAAAHRAPTPLGLWGGFDSGPALCQRVVGRAAVRCGNAVWAARAACLEAEIAAGTCDQQATETAVQQAHQDALDMIDQHCADYAFDLGFTLTLEMQADVDTFCQQLDTALVSGVYGPLLARSVPQPQTADESICTSGLAAAATHMLHTAFRARTRALDQIASRALPPTAKRQLVDRSGARIQRALAHFEAALRRQCPDERFVPLYGHTVSTALTLIAQRADCLAGAAYVQDAVLCPAAVCGNGMVEPAEECDDGNTMTGDGCDGTCHRELPQL